MNNQRLSEWMKAHRRLIHMMVIFPAVMLGVFAMAAEGASSMLWGQHIAAFIVFALLGLLRKNNRRIPPLLGTALCLLALSATLFFPAVGGTRRWLDLGIFNVNAGMLVIPALIVLVNGIKYAYPVAMLTAAVLCLQPDFSQLAAFSLGMLPVLWQRRRHVVWSVATAILLIVALIRCAGIPTALEPAAYSEGILALLDNFSPLMQGIGWLALAVIPGYFVCWSICHKSVAVMCLAIYYTVGIAFSLTGQYPVPFMGFGLSPIAGYWLAFLFVSE